MERKAWLRTNFYLVMSFLIIGGLWDQNIVDRILSFRLSSALKNLNPIEIRKESVVPQKWLFVTNESMAIYSGFVDRIDKNHTIINILGFIHAEDLKTKKAYLCRVRGGNWSELELRMQTRKVTLENGIFKCHLYGSVPARIDSVFIKRKWVPPAKKRPKKPQTDIEPVNATVTEIPLETPAQTVQRTLGVCVMQPLFNFKQWISLAFFLEFYLAAGVEFFVFYKLDWSNDVEKLLKFYASYVEIVPWPRLPPMMFPNGKLDPDPMRLTPIHGQFLQMHHCLYRFGPRFKYLAFLDTDEFINVRTLPFPNSLATFLRESDRLTVGAFNFRHVYAVHTWVDSVNITLDAVIARNISVFNFDGFRRDLVVWPIHYRSKFIVKPRAVGMMVEHLVAEFRERIFHEELVEPATALLYHIKHAGIGMNYIGEKSYYFTGDRKFLEIAKKIEKRFRQRVTIK